MVKLDNCIDTSIVITVRAEDGSISTASFGRKSNSEPIEVAAAMLAMYPKLGMKVLSVVVCLENPDDPELLCKEMTSQYQGLKFKEETEKWST